MAKMIILAGLPGAGKSTLAKKMVKQDPTYVRVNLDDIRSMLGTSDFNKEKLVEQIELISIGYAFNQKYNVIVDDTNLNPKKINKLKVIAKQYNAEVDYKLISTDVEECIRRDALRERPVGEDVIRRFYEKYHENL